MKLELEPLPNLDLRAAQNKRYNGAIQQNQREVWRCVVPGCYFVRATDAAVAEPSENDLSGD